MNLYKKNFFKIIFLILICSSFFIGYFLRENAAGGGFEFFEMEWITIQSFRNDFLYTVNNYGRFRDYTLPFPYMFSALLNPFSNDIENFQLSNTIISFIIFIILSVISKSVLARTIFFFGKIIDI